MPAVLQTDKSLSETGGEGENAVASFHFVFGAKDSSLFIRLLVSFAHKTMGGWGGLWESNKKK